MVDQGPQRQRRTVKEQELFGLKKTGSCVDLWSPIYLSMVKCMVTESHKDKEKP